MIIELLFHYLTILFLGDFTGTWGAIDEDSPLLDIAYAVSSSANE